MMNKLLTFSYDDGITQDQRLIHLFDKYGMKCTFNINSGRLGIPGLLIRNDRTVAHVKPRAEEVASIYQGHEIAGHSLTHPSLTTLPDEEIIKEVEEDRKILSDLAGYEVVGMAYPNGVCDERVKRVIAENTGIKYARTTISTGSFEPQKGDWLALNATIYNLDWDEMFSLAHQFVDLKADSVQMFYVWGHAYEFDAYDTWEKFEEFLKILSGKSDICYCTNREAIEIITGEKL